MKQTFREWLRECEIDDFYIDIEKKRLISFIL